MAVVVEDHVILAFSRSTVSNSSLRMSVLISFVAGSAFFPHLFLYHAISYHFLFSELPTQTLAGHTLALSPLTHLTLNTQQAN